MPRFEDGNPGGPGRPPGTRNRSTILMEMLGSDAAATAIEIIDEELKKRTRWGAGMVARLSPKPSGLRIELDLPEIKSAADIRTAQSRVTQAMARGQISTGEAQAITGVLAHHLRAIELALLDERLDRIEKAVEHDARVRRALPQKRR